MTTEVDIANPVIEEGKDPKDSESETVKSPNGDAPTAQSEQPGLQSQQQEQPPLASDTCEPIVGGYNQQIVAADVVKEDKPPKRISKDVVARRLGLPLKSDMSDLGKLRTPTVRNKFAQTRTIAESVTGEKQQVAATEVRRAPNSLLRFSGVAGRALAAAVAASTGDQPKTKWSSSRLRMDSENMNMKPRAQAKVASTKTMTKQSHREKRQSRKPLVGGFGYGEGGGSNESDQHDKNDKDDKVDGSASEKERQPAKPNQRVSSFAPANARQDVRSRNIVGKMLGHLKSAKRELAKVKVEAKSEEDEEKNQDHWVPRKSPSHDLSSNFSDEVEEDELPSPKRRKNDGIGGMRTHEQEMMALQRNLQTHYSLMKNFIRTRSEPTIFFLPAKHNKKSLKELQDTRETIDHKIASLKVHLQGAGSDRSDKD